MSLLLEMPKESETHLRSLFGEAVSRAVIEAAAIELYRETKLSIGQLARMLGMRVMEADEWLAKRGVMIPYTDKDIEEELATIKRIERQ